MSDWISHPLAAFGGFMFALVFLRIRSRHPIKLDVTVRQEDRQE